MATDQGVHKDDKLHQAGKKNKRTIKSAIKQKEKQSQKENVNLEVPALKRTRRMATPFEARWKDVNYNCEEIYWCLKVEKW